MSEKPLTMHPFESSLVRYIEADITRLTAEVERLKRQVAEWVDAGGGAHSVIERQMEDRAKLRAAIECALRQLADGKRVSATGTLAAALSGDKQ